MGNDYILEMDGIYKQFPGVRALDNVTFKIRNKEIHGLVGENGAGKSTLMKILGGIYAHDAGEIYFNGELQTHITPRHIEDLGITFIHQERYVVPHLTVAESLYLGIEPTVSPFKLINRKKLKKDAERIIFEKVGFKVDASRRMEELTVGEQQLVQICRALLQNPKVIVFDEPTAVLAAEEAKRLFEIIRELGKKIAIIYISHYFGEILDLCDRVTVLRNGEFVDTVKTDGMTIKDLVLIMIGRDIGEQYPPRSTKKGEVLIEAQHLTHKKAFRDISFYVREGEVVGFTGLMGSGHSELGAAIYDTSDLVSGTIKYKGKEIKSNNHVKAVKMGMGYVPEDRRGLGVIQSMSVKENTTLASLDKVSRHGVIDKKEEYSRVEKLILDLGVKTPTTETGAGFLSGGNQQKVVISKWVSSDSSLYIMNQPTSGVDIGARAEIYALIRRMTETGTGVLLITQDINELVGMSDRVYIMYRGELCAEFDVDNDIADQITVAMMGGNIND